MEVPGVKSKNNIVEEGKADHDIAITVYTDPLCCWSWAFQPQLEELQKHLGNRATWQYRMGGLIPSWNNFHDEVNSVTRPAQMGPVWMHAGIVANMPIYHQLWMKDPPSSSYPSCIATKCVELQSGAFVPSFLQLLREACMTEGRNISRQDVLFETATKLYATNPEFSISTFKSDYAGDAGISAFRADLELVRYYNINRFPTLVIKSLEKAIIVSGYRPYSEVLRAMETIIPRVM